MDRECPSSVSSSDTSYYREGVFKRIAPFYDPLFAVVFAFLGGQRRVRRGLVDFARPQPGEQVLDVCCGTGALTVLVGERVGASGRVVGLDLSQAMIAVAKKKVRKMPWVSFRQGDAQRLPFADSAFDKTFVSFGLHEMPDDNRACALEEIARTLKPDGGLYVLEFNLPERGVARWLTMSFVRIVEEKPAIQMLRTGSLLPGMRCAGFDVVNLEYLFHRASVMVHATPSLSKGSTGQSPMPPVR